MFFGFSLSYILNENPKIKEKQGNVRKNLRRNVKK